jgi:amino acid adenylation domain-containing protein
VRGLGRLFEESAERHAKLPALVVDGQTYRYDDLHGRARAVAAAIAQVDDGGSPLGAICAERSLAAYVGILGTLMAGRGYVPLTPSFPPERTRSMLERSGARTVVADAAGLEALADVADEGTPLTVIAPGEDRAPGRAPGAPHRVLCSGDLPPGDRAAAAPAGPEEIAYLLFTSGTTGTPKGIGIRQRNVGAYLAAVAERYDLGPGDRCSQNFALTFDLSVHDLFVSWGAGACVCVPPARTAMAPGRFVADQALTSWFSTPSTAAMMLKLRMLRPGAFPSLRWSLFCGEALTVDVADAWRAAAPGSALDNLYGPTEATIACTAFRYVGANGDGEFANGVVPIGRPFGTTRVAVVDGSMQPVAPGEAGELLLGGGQLAGGYWGDAERTGRAFVSVPALEPAGPWYRTGDLASLGAHDELVYRGRIDDQIKIRGHRVELQEVESVVRAASDASSVVALGWPRTAAGADGIIVFLSGGSAADEAVLEGCRRTLPDYMVPREVHRVEAMPLNPSGKVDRRRLLETREAMR